MRQNAQRYFSLDLHKNRVTIAAVHADQTTAVAPFELPMSHLDSWASRKLRPDDSVVIEAGPNTWSVYDMLSPICMRVVVADSRKLRAIAAGAPKTDERDAVLTARLLAAGFVPEVWVPPAHVRELRGLIRYRSRLVRRSTAARNRLHALLTRYRVFPPEGNIFGPDLRSWWMQLSISSTERLRAGQDLATLDVTAEQLTEVEAELARLSVSDEWRNSTTFLMQLPGFAVVSTMTVMAAIGTIDRFKTPGQLVGYSGLCPRVRQSGDTLRTGGISKTGRRELRTVMVQVAWAAVRTDPRWRNQFQRLQHRIGSGKAITAIARKILVLVWHVLSRQEHDRNRDPKDTARKLLRWASEFHLATATGSTRKDFVAARLADLGLAGFDVTVASGRSIAVTQRHALSDASSRRNLSSIDRLAVRAQEVPKGPIAGEPPMEGVYRFPSHRMEGQTALPEVCPHPYGNLAGARVALQRSPILQQDPTRIEPHVTGRQQVTQPGGTGILDGFPHR